MFTALVGFKNGFDAAADDFKNGLLAYTGFGSSTFSGYAAGLTSSVLGGRLN